MATAVYRRARRCCRGNLSLYNLAFTGENEHYCSPLRTYLSVELMPHRVVEFKSFIPGDDDHETVGEYDIRK
ncbi:hypothetical protein K450DRAFT_255824 [Umbelopsis ramanniana AG]|uniref:Uncharacterized protein n=1 Tax=Umbelopsis ramanniana AG TaxID=1314678 RepID=A0AAD5E3A7_UMBRA|nr:uncharacterized protein K450DRAFT_255824 [Umbelopsis ramanniana AG]KAI8576606.1 hypothetical protein K450DRAFT_255824 [Umbelopsis ramanniana AG]